VTRPQIRRGRDASEKKGKNKRNGKSKPASGWVRPKGNKRKKTERSSPKYVPLSGRKAKMYEKKKTKFKSLGKSNRREGNVQQEKGEKRRKR